MGNRQSLSPTYAIRQQTINQPYKITYHSHQNTPDLLRIFKLFLHDPYRFIYSIEVEIQQHNCCNRTVLKVKSPKHSFNLQNLLNIKRTSKGFFVERQIWYIIKRYMQAAGTVLGVFNPRAFNLDNGRFLTVEVLHLMPYNQHDKNLSLHNYYSPQKLKEITNQQVVSDIFKSQVFSLGLLILEIATCPSSKPKFHRSNLSQIIWNQIISRFQIAQQRYSQKFCQFLQMVLREDVRIRPDWNYLRIWLMKNEPFIDIAPCIFWST